MVDSSIPETSQPPDEWHRVPELDQLADGRVATAIVDGRALCITRCGDQLGALDNRCPHQGGPLGEGSIEGGLLRCPWHGYDYDPITGKPPAGFSDAPVAYPVRRGEAGAEVLLPAKVAHQRSVSDVMVETMV